MTTFNDTELATLPELMVIRELSRRGFHNGVDYTFQSSQLGGRIEKGGLVVDFLFNDLPLAFSVLGEYYHYNLGSEPRARDRYSFMALAAQGITLIFLDEVDILADAGAVVEDGLNFVDRSKRSRGE